MTSPMPLEKTLRRSEHRSLPLFAVNLAFIPTARKVRAPRPAVAPASRISVLRR